MKIDLSKTSPQFITSKIKPKIDSKKSNIKNDREKASYKELVLDIKNLSTKGQAKTFEFENNIRKHSKIMHLSLENDCEVQKIVNMEKEESNKFIKTNLENTSNGELLRAESIKKTDNIVNKFTNFWKKNLEKTSKPKSFEPILEVQPILEKMMHFGRSSEENGEPKIQKIRENNRKIGKKTELNLELTKKEERNHKTPDDFQNFTNSHCFKKSLDDFNIITTHSDDTKKNIKQLSDDLKQNLDNFLGIPKQGKKNLGLKRKKNPEMKAAAHSNLEKNSILEKNRNTKEKSEKIELFKTSNVRRNLELNENDQNLDFEEIEKKICGMEKNEQRDKNSNPKKFNNKNLKLSLSGDYREIIKMQKKKEEGFFKNVGR
jgi:hypothetical protein